MRLRASLLLLVGALAALASAQLPPSEIPIERLYQYPLINGRSPSGAQMSPDGSKIVFGWNKTGQRKLDVWILDFPNGKPRPLLEASSIKELPRQDDERKDDEKKDAELYDGGISGFTWAPDSRDFVFSYKGRVWLLGADGKNLRALFDANLGIGGVQFSPDNRFISYQQGQNVFRMERRTRTIKQLTFVSKGGTTVGGHDWSPDGKNILIRWSDSSKLGSHVMMDFSKDRATVVNIRRMWNGELSQNEQIGVIPVDGGLIKFVPDLPRGNWTEAVEWSPDGSGIAISTVSEDFKKWTLYHVPVASETLKPTTVMEQTAPSNYINDWRPVVWTRDSKRIIFGTDIMNGKFINRSLYSIQPDGKDLREVYVEKHDIGAVMRPKDSDRLILVTAARSPLKTEITILEPDGKRTQYAIKPDGYSTPKDFNWASSPLVSDDGKRIATLASERSLNNELYSVEPKVARLTESQLPEFAKIRWAKIEEVTFDAPDGRKIHGLLMTPQNLDPNKKVPAVISGIYADSGKAAWAGWVENYLASELGMAVLCVDFRSSWGYDGEFNSGYYEKMGLVDVDEAVAAKKYLASLPYVRGDRVGIWGWSYGGYLTCMALLTKPGEFHAGVAVASVTDWKSYNEWYTRRRLGLVKDDKDKIFEKTSPITYASGLKDHLLLVHGMLDDNVLFQDTARLAQRLIENGKYFDLMAYPRDDHGIGRNESRPHVFATIVRYLYEKLNQP